MKHSTFKTFWATQCMFSASYCMIYSINIVYNISIDLIRGSKIPNCIQFQVHFHTLPVLLQQFYSTTDPQVPHPLPAPPIPPCPSESPGPALPMHFFKSPSRWATNWGSKLKIVACCSTMRRSPPVAANCYDNSVFSNTSVLKNISY